MNYLVFILWLILYPLFEKLGEYFEAKTREITGDNHPGSNISLLAAVVNLVIWVFIAVLLWEKMGC